MLRSAQHDIGKQRASRGHTERSEVSHTTSTVVYLEQAYWLPLDMMRPTSLRDSKEMMWTKNAL